MIGDEIAMLYCQGDITNLLEITTFEDNWSVKLPPQEAGTLCNLEVVSTAKTLTLEQVIFGDVWLCSGQSNMELSMKFIMNSDEEITASADYMIRFARVTHTFTADADDYADTNLVFGWAESSEGQWLRRMSAVCYLYARNIQDMMAHEGEEVVPLGMVESAWGGTNIEPWSPPQALEACDCYYECNPVVDPHRCNSRLWNGMINPLKRNPFMGFLWYQGESNTGINKNLYNCSFPTLIDWWRKEFSENGATDPNAPFGFVQLSTDRDPDLDKNQNNFPVIRWHQTA